MAAAAALLVLAGRAVDLDREAPVARPAASQPTPDALNDALQRSRALTTAPAVTPSGRQQGPIPPPLSAAELTRYLQRLQGELPYPPGREDTELPRVLHTPRNPEDMTGVSSAADARLVAEYRAWCSWLQAWLQDGNPQIRDAAARILQDVPRWPTYRRSARSARAAGATIAVAKGDRQTVANLEAGGCGR
jgi:hypothetical protein